MAQAEAQVRQVATNIERLTMTAPMEGIILQKKVRVGQYAQCGPSSEPLMVMGGGAHLNIRADIDESDAWRVRANTAAVAYIRGDTRQRIPLEFVRFEPYVVPKKSLTGDSTERVDTRVLQVIYRIHDEKTPVYVGQQMDIYIEASPSSTAAAKADGSSSGGVR